MQKKAAQIKASILEDEDVSEAIKKKYESFEGSNGWLDRFKKKYSILSRAVTTKCKKLKEEMVPLIAAYFEKLNETIRTKKPKLIYNMDEMAIFF